PQSGVVVGLKFRSRLGVIPPGASILDIVPSEDRLVFEARVRPEDIDVVRVGQTAQVRLTAYKQRSTLTVNGRLIHISADRFLDERTGLGYYLAKIEPDPDSLAAAGDVQLQAGMPAEVMIQTGARLAIEYMVNPVIISFTRAFRED
ncbi:MAG TPA: HlyD family efflux transporter periplasmic adaptor subunit, partial [Alphaproteobacteria bacterium]|nr:HlyD family efflux transporter periplasmic adaptor subunit [Alphaproteobacteria bacterium]